MSKHVNRISLDLLLEKSSQEGTQIQSKQGRRYEALIADPEYMDATAGPDKRRKGEMTMLEMFRNTNKSCHDVPGRVAPSP
jgi:hypothetical protein